MKRAERVDGEDEDNGIGLVWKENPRAVFLPPPDARVINGAEVSYDDKGLWSQEGKAE